MKIVEYKTVKADDVDYLDRMLKDLIQDYHFQPFGNPYVIGSSVCQVMVKYDKD